MLLIEQLANEIFDRKFLCNLRPKHKMHVLQQQGELTLLDLATVDGKLSLDGVSMTGYSPNEKHIRAMFSGQGHLADNEDNDDLTSDVNLYASIMYGTTINDMVELWDAFNYICFDNYEDIITVYDTLDAYIRAVEDFSLTSKNYRGVTEEDMKKMLCLLKAVEDRAEGLMVLGHNGESTFQNFMSKTGLGGGNFGNLTKDKVLKSSRQRRAEAKTDSTAIDPTKPKETTRMSVSTAGNPFEFLRNGRD